MTAPTEVGESARKARVGSWFAHPEVKWVGISLALVLVAVLVLWVAASVADLEGDAVYVALLILPFIVYAVLSGRLLEVKGPGGWEAKFAQVASAPVEHTSTTLPWERLQVVAKGGPRALDGIRAQLDESEPVVLTLTVGHRYQPGLLTRHIETLSHFRNFKFVVLHDEQGRVVAYAPQWAVRSLLADPGLGRRFIADIANSNVGDLLRFPGVVRKTISEKAANADALAQMEELNLEALVVTADDGSLRGIVEREQVLSKMMLALTR
jgi:hypothetical protein